MCHRWVFVFSAPLAGFLCVVLCGSGCSCSRDEMPERTQSAPNTSSTSCSPASQNGRDADDPVIAADPSETPDIPKARTIDTIAGCVDQPAVEKSAPNASRAGSGSGAPNPPTSSASPSSSGGSPPMSGDPQKASREAAKLTAKAEKSAAAGDHGRAYQQALSAWQKVAPHAQYDNECRELAATLLGRLKRYGEAANRKAGGTGRTAVFDKPLLVK